MKKQLKDYLHLYPKVAILIIEKGAPPVPHYLEGIDWMLDKVIAERVNWDYSQIKPVLRPLNDMTKEEAAHIADLGTRFAGRVKFEMKSLDVTSLQAYILVRYETKDKKLGDFEYEDQIVIGSDGIYVRDFQYRDELGHHTKGFEIVAYLLKQGFDLFQLIEEGLAIDMTKLPLKLEKA